MKVLRALAFWLMIFNPAVCVVHINLSGLSWTARLDMENGTSFQVPGTVPGGIYTDLMKGGALNSGDFYYRFNDDVYRYPTLQRWKIN